MDRKLGYSSIVKKFLLGWQEYAGKCLEDGLELLVSFDDDHGFYLLMELGWEKKGRIRDIYFILRIRDGKVWIEENRTDRDIAVELMDMGIPREDIVLGLLPPWKRPYTDYAAA